LCFPREPCPKFHLLHPCVDPEGKESMKKHPFMILALAAAAAAGLFTLRWAPVEGDFQALRVKSFGRVMAEIAPTECSVELNEDYIINPEACIGCQICLNSCPVGAISMTEDNKAWIDPGKCILCGLCVASCPVDAIVTVGEENLELYGVNEEEVPIEAEFEVN